MSSLPGEGTTLRGAVALPSPQQRRWRDLVDHLPALVAFWDAELRNVIANRAYLSWLGIPPEQMHGRHMREVLGDSVFEVSRPYVEAALRGEDQHFERAFVTSSREPRQAHVDYIPEVVDGQVTGFYALVTDVTEEVRARDDLLEAQSLAGLGSFTFRPRTQQVSFSPELLRIMGLNPAGPSPELDAYLDMVHPEDRARVDAAREMADEGVPYETGYRIVRPDGTVRHVRSRARQIVDDEGHTVVLRGVMQDETQVQRASADLESANRLLTDLIGVLGHDLRQPIAVIRGYLEHADDSWDEAPEAVRRRWVSTALRAANRMDGLLADILALANLDTGQLEPRPTQVDVGSLVREILDATSLEVETDLSPSATAYADPVHVRQVLANLLSNAGRYGQPPYVVDARSEDGQVVVSVRDHGEGVPPTFVPHLFDRFTRADTGVATTVPGTGFGLYIVRSLARANDGDVTYSPGRPRGATFELRLPGAPQPARHVSAPA